MLCENAVLQSQDIKENLLVRLWHEIIILLAVEQCSIERSSDDTICPRSFRFQIFSCSIEELNTPFSLYCESCWLRS
jgi:hypothetical protein